MPDIIGKSLPEALQFLRGGIDPEEVDCLERTMQCRSRGGKSFDMGNRVYIIPHTYTENTKFNATNLLRVLEKWKEVLKSEQCRHISPINVIALGQTTGITSENARNLYSLSRSGY